MTVNDLLISVRQKLDDMQKLNFSDIELIAWLNRAITDLCIKLATDKDAEVLKSVTLTNNTGVVRPSDFLSFAGVYPVEAYIDTGVMKLRNLNSSFIGTMEVRYFGSKTPVATLTDTVPFTRQQDLNALIDSVALLASPPQVQQGGK